jgi:hypothetical protein
MRESVGRNKGREEGDVCTIRQGENVFAVEYIGGDYFVFP